ncbi:MAG: hypothetical protein RR228_00190 [Bacilli bacterium]
MKNKFRLIIYGSICFVSLLFGILGFLIYYKNNKITYNETKILKNISSEFNKSKSVIYFEKYNTTLSAKTIHKKIEVKYVTTIYNRKYTIDYDNGLLTYNFDKTSSIQNTIFKVLVDSISIMNGRDSEETFYTLEKTNLNNYTLNNGLTYKVNGNNVTAIINTKVPLTIKLNEPSSTNEIPSTNEKK